MKASFERGEWKSRHLAKSLQRKSNPRSTRPSKKNLGVPCVADLGKVFFGRTVLTRLAGENCLFGSIMCVFAFAARVKGNLIVVVQQKTFALSNKTISATERVPRATKSCCVFLLPLKKTKEKRLREKSECGEFGLFVCSFESQKSSVSVFVCWLFFLAFYRFQV